MEREILLSMIQEEVRKQEEDIKAAKAAMKKH